MASASSSSNFSRLSQKGGTQGAKAYQTPNKDQHDFRTQGNFIGTDVARKRVAGNRNGLVVDGASDNVIGGTTPESRNIISGNTLNGLWLSGSRNLVRGNFIGTDVTGTVALGNAVGIGTADSSDHIIGGSIESARNFVSGNSDTGIFLSRRTVGNVIQGNLIGTDTSGRAALGNRQYGIYIWSPSHDNTIGGPTPGSGNRIAFNRGPGVLMEPDAGTGNAIRGNSIFANTEYRIGDRFRLGLD